MFSIFCLRRPPNWILPFIFSAFIIGPVPVRAEQSLLLLSPGPALPLSQAFNPLILKGLKVHPDNPLRFDFILSQGENASDGIIADRNRPDSRSYRESTKLIKYFLAGLTIPEQDLWVNLSPYEKNHIVPDAFGQTQMGRDLLAEDYILKQISASLTYPDSQLGKAFWTAVYKQAKQLGTGTNYSINTFNKVWIVPDKAVVYENAKAGTVYIVQSTLKVMLEEDYLAVNKNNRATPHQGATSKILRQIIIPELNKEVNQGKNFAQLRQVYNSIILAAWYKQKIKDSILAAVYENKNKTTGLASLQGSESPEAIYQRYIQAFKKGAYNLVKEETDPTTQLQFPRKYFSGGFAADHIGRQLTIDNTMNMPLPRRGALELTTELAIINDDKAMSGSQDVFHRSYLKHLSTQAYHQVNFIPQQGKRVKWLMACLTADALIRRGWFVRIESHEIQINMDKLLAYTFLTWLAKGGAFDEDLALRQQSFYKEYKNNEQNIKDWAKHILQQRNPATARQGYFMPVNYPSASRMGRYAQDLLKVEMQESLFNLDQFGYGDVFVQPGLAENVLKPQGLNIAILGNWSPNRILLSKYGGDADSGVNVIFMPVPTFIKVDAQGRVFASSGIVFKEGRPYFIEFKEPLRLHYVRNYTNLSLEQTHIPMSGNKFLSDYIDEKDITLQIARQAGIKTAVSRLILIKQSSSIHVIRRRRQEAALFNLEGFSGNMLYGTIREALIDFLQVNHINQGVLKPNKQFGGRRVLFFNMGNVQAAAKHATQLMLSSEENILLQQRLESAPLVINGLRQDWNVRVLVSMNSQGGAQAVDMVVRYGPYGGVISGTRGASWDTLEHLRLQLGLDEKQLGQLKARINKMAEQTFTAIQGAMTEDGILKKGEVASDFMGIDIMVIKDGEDLVPYLIEANGFNAGGGWDLDRVLMQHGETDRMGRWAKADIETMRQRALAYKKQVDAAMVVRSKPTELFSKAALLANVREVIDNYSSDKIEEFFGIFQEYRNITSKQLDFITQEAGWELTMANRERIYKRLSDLRVLRKLNFEFLRVLAKAIPYDERKLLTLAFYAKYGNAIKQADVLGNALRWGRWINGNLTAKEVYGQIGMDPGNYSRLEAGNYKPDPQKIERIERILGYARGTLINMIAYKKDINPRAILSDFNKSKVERFETITALDLTTKMDFLANELYGSDSEAARKLVEERINNLRKFGIVNYSLVKAIAKALDENEEELLILAFYKKYEDELNVEGNAFGKALKLGRWLKGDMPVSRISVLLGIKNRDYWEFEKGENFPSKSLIPKINKLFGFSPRIDPAMNGRNTGGIDLAAPSVASQLGANSSAIGFHMTPARLKALQKVQGFVPVIVGIRPVADLGRWLGLNDQKPTRAPGGMI